jgi:hypothetical protein
MCASGRAARAAARPPASPREQLAEPLPTLSRSDKAFPIGDGEIDRRQRASRQDRAGDDDTRGRFLPDDQQRADAEHRRLQRHAQHAPGRTQPAGHVVDALLLREVRAAEIEPAAAQRLRHAHRGERIGVAPADLREAVAQGRLRGGGLDRAA